MIDLLISKIRLDGGTQPRSQMNWVVIAEYTEAMQEGVAFPAVVVFHDGTDHWLADGFHRVHAAQSAELESINADVRQGTRRDAVLFSVGANAQHGLRRTNEDKRRSVETLLHDDEWRGWSDNEIARRCMVAVSTVGKYRKELSLSNSNSEKTYTTKHGTIAVMNTANIGRTADPVVNLAKEHDVTDVKAVDMLAQVREKSPTLFDVIVTTGAVLGLDGVDIPLSEASATDIRLAADEEARERAIRHMMHQNGHMKPNGVPKALQMSESNEWYTPAPYIEAARLVMGSIDIDPASNPVANEIVKAATYYTIETNGLDKNWPGNVWLNPPYGRDSGDSNQDLWSARLVQQHKDGITKQAVLLVNAVTDRKWFQPLWEYPICFTNHRIRFYDTSGEAGQPTHGNALIYLGGNIERFAEVFTQFGVIVAQWNAKWLAAHRGNIAR